jgi:hypothetical protein
MLKDITRYRSLCECKQKRTKKNAKVSKKDTDIRNDRRKERKKSQTQCQRYHLSPSSSKHHTEAAHSSNLNKRGSKNSSISNIIHTIQSLPLLNNSTNRKTEK